MAEIPNQEIDNQKENITKPIEANCIRKDTRKWLCELKTFIFETDEEKAFSQIEELLKAQKWLSEKVSAEDENEVLIILKSPANKFHLVKLPRSFWEKQKLEVNIEWKNISLEAIPKTNWYNTEYLINNWWWDWKQIAILFTLINPEWNKQKKIVDSLENEKKQILESIKKSKELEISLRKKLAKEKIENYKKPKKHKIQSNTLKNIEENKEKFKLLLSDLKKVDSKKINETKILNKINKLIDFPYTPYNKSYDKEETRSHWFSYIDSWTKSSFQKLGNEKSLVWSKDKKLEIKEAFSHDIATVLNIVERMDYYMYFERDWITLKNEKEILDIMNKQIQKALTTIALNQKWAFNWQRSKVWALWIWQFMPKTYENIKNRYNHLFPEDFNFENWAKDHSTSFRMQALHFHEESRAMPKWIKENWTEILKDEKSKIWLYALIAAWYNWSITRVVKEAELWEKFDKDLLHPDKLIARLSKNKETQTYVMKFVYTWESLEKNYREFWK